MHDMLPVYLDCNYDVLEKVINELQALDEMNVTLGDIAELMWKIEGELKSRYNGEINSSKIEQMNNMVKRIINGISSSINKIQSYDELSRDKLRDYVEKALNYTNPIDRSKYPHLSEEKINEIYDYILTGDSSILSPYKYRGDFDIDEGKEVLKLILQNNLDNVFFSDIKLLFKSMNYEEREEIYNMLKYSRIKISNNGDYQITYYVDGDEFRTFGENLLGNSEYDDDTIMLIYGGIYYKKHGTMSARYSGSEPTFTLKFGDLIIESDWNNFENYCDKNSFDYLNFFKDNVNMDTTSDGKVIFNLNGFDCNISLSKLKEVLSPVKTETSSGVALTTANNRFIDYNSEKNSLKFIKYLIDSNAFSSDDLDKKNKISVLGNNIEISMNDIANCFDSENEFDVKKLLENVKLSESATIYYKTYLREPVLSSDYTVVASSDAYNFFSNCGSVDQGSIKYLISQPWDYKKYIDELVEFGSKKYGLTEDEVYIIMNSMDNYNDSGVCSYADACNVIYELYDYDEEKFEKDFGYPMLKHGRINGNQLLLDIYINTNISTDDSSLIIKNEDGSLKLNSNFLVNDQKIDSTKQKYFMYNNDENKGLEYLDNFLQANNNNMLNEYDVINVIADSNKNYYNNKLSTDSYAILKEAMENGDAISMDMYDFKIYQVNSYQYFDIEHGHAVTPVGLTEDGVLVRSWGSLYYLPYEDVNTFTIFRKKN